MYLTSGFFSTATLGVLSGLGQLEPSEKQKFLVAVC